MVSGSAQGPFCTVQANTFTPTGRPVMLVFGSLGSVMVPPPLTRVHVPKAGTVTALPCMVVLVFGVHSS